MEYQEASSATFSKKLKSTYSFSGKSIYDGVFGGTAKVASRVVEDYGEIFGGSGGPSVPVLDVPELNERKVSVDVNSAKLDYSKIFGGFGEFDFGVSHEKLAAAKPNKRESFVEEVRTSAETISHALFSQETSYQSLNGVEQFKTSFSKTNQGRKSGTNGKTHIAQLNAVPGYACLLNEAAPSQMSEGDKPLPSVSNCDYHNINCSGEILQGIASRKAMSTHPPGVARKQPSTDGIKFKIKSNSGRSNSIDMSFDAYEIGIRTQPSRVQQPSTQLHGLSNNKGASEIPVASNSGVSKGHSSGDVSGICSPPYFDDEVDVNSVAAASAAAVKKAIEEAQARIRIAKEINERKKEGRNHVKLIFKNGSKVEERKEGKIADKVNKFQDEACEKYGKTDKPMPVAALGAQNAVKADQVAPEFRERDNLFLAERASSGMHANENKTTLVDPRWEEMQDWKSERQGDIGAKLMQLVNECEVKEKSFANKRFEVPEKNVEKLEFVEEAHKQEKIERKLNVMEGACGMKEFSDKSNSDQAVHGVEEYEKRSMVGLPEEMEVTFTASHRIEDSGEKLRSIDEPSETKLEMLDVADNEYMKMRIQKDEQEWLKKEQKLKETFKLEENDNRSEDVLENEVGLQEIFHRKEKGERDELACNRVELDEQQKEACTAEESEVGQMDVHSRKEVEETSDKTEGQQKINGQKSEKKLDEENELVAKENFIGAEENVKTLEEVYEMIEIEKRREENSEWKQAENVQAGIDQRAENENTITQEALQHWNTNLEGAYDFCKQDENETLSEILEVSGDQENNECLETPTNEENEEVMEVTEDSSEWKEIETESNAVVELANELEEKEVSEVKMTGMAQVTLDLNEIEKQVQDTTKAFSFDYNRVDLRTMDTNVPPMQNDLHGKESGIPSVADKHDEELTCESEEIFEDAEEVEVAMELEENESNFELSHEEKSFDNWKDSEGTHPPGMFQEKEETAEISHKIETSKNIEKHGENYSKALKTEEREAEGSSQKELELEKDHVQKIDKEKEKEREREKERIAVERAIREARERAFTEARERAEKAAAEKANAEARRRAVAEARERLEKTSAETNGKSSADKTYMEARLKAERAAVQRATAEARERALERAMSEKAALGTRNQAVKSSGASRDTGIRQNYASNDSQPRGSGPTRSLGNPNSFNNGVNGESMQRDKASLERDKRTAERAAKALAEKNMRDLLAQKEQAERNRLAEALDADVKRWSSGKAGNLRALLSTLQFILGPDSGWEPIRLTDLLTSTAVKKAYRKATLFVHPDKLQQRGASIQQKYICEKVFDLLKEAWNKFSGEER